MSMRAAPSDAELVRRCRAGDAEAWSALVERFSRYVYAICTRGFHLPTEEAEDAFQDVFTRVYTSLGTLRDESALRPWIAQLTRRVCLDTIARRRPEEPLEAPPDVATGDLAEIDEAFQVREALRRLSPQCQEILDRFFARDESYRTISEELDLPSGTIASRIARCLAKLRLEFEGRNKPPAVSGK
ncbi:MAG: DNA-directed RNA polymerase sigma-70 factor [Gaiellaceae bacterium]|jgi:RNA polymerase sigma factor (sigma-70 family)|nr:MAG: DNA-directed RNA polymerase sigma-70 factor [Gaiellaceae bacterium]